MDGRFVPPFTKPSGNNRPKKLQANPPKFTPVENQADTDRG
jgi:hypothetical protein